METRKNLCAMLPVALHTRVRQEQEKAGMTLGEYVEAMITEYYDWKDGKIMTGEMRTLAAQIPAELFDRLDRYLKERGIKKKDFLVDIITRALEEAEAAEPVTEASPQDELELLRRRSGGPVVEQVSQVTDRAGLERLRQTVEAVHISDEVLEYIVRLVGATRSHPAIAQGGSPRATLAVAAVSRAAAFIRGRDYVLPDDVTELFRDTVAHRLILTDAAGTGDPLGDVLASVRAPRLK